jgi:hypothetical protein
MRYSKRGEDDSFAPNFDLLFPGWLAAIPMLFKYMQNKYLQMFFYLLKCYKYLLVDTAVMSG